MNKKIMAGAGVAAIAAILATALVASAQTTTTSGITPVTSNEPEPQVLQVSQSGEVLMRGTIASISSGELTVNGWGGTWTVNVGSGAQILPAAANGDLTQFAVGDYVGVQGTVSASANWTINATLVRDWTYREAAGQERQQNVQTAKQTVQGETARNYVGTASNITATSFSLAGTDGNAYTVQVAPGAEVVNRNWLSLPLASINSGDSVRVWGTNASGTVTVQIVRDMSIPATSSATSTTQ